MEHDDFAVEVCSVDDVLVMAVRGELDVVSTAVLRTELERHPPEAHVVVDCRGLPFIDSSGLQLLIEQAHSRELSGGSLRLRNCLFPVRQVVELIGLMYLFELDEGDGTPDLGVELRTAVPERELRPSPAVARHRGTGAALLCASRTSGG
ncbi:MAG: hypothetical protein QOE00_2636 [Ilumatobacteraceae bacterium]